MPLVQNYSDNPSTHTIQMIMFKTIRASAQSERLTEQQLQMLSGKPAKPIEEKKKHYSDLIIGINEHNTFTEPSLI